MDGLPIQRKDWKRTRCLCAPAGSRPIFWGRCLPPRLQLALDLLQSGPGIAGVRHPASTPHTWPGTPSGSPSRCPAGPLGERWVHYHAPDAAEDVERPGAALGAIADRPALGLVKDGQAGCTVAFLSIRSTGRIADRPAAKPRRPRPHGRGIGRGAPGSRVQEHCHANRPPGRPVFRSFRPGRSAMASRDLPCVARRPLQIVSSFRSWPRSTAPVNSLMRKLVAAKAPESAPEGLGVGRAEEPTSWKRKALSKRPDRSSPPRRPRPR